MQMPDANNNLILVIPTILENHPDGIKIDRDFSNNLIAYLERFDRVEVYCPDAEVYGGFPALCDIRDIPGYERLSVNVLPIPYREDRYVRHYLKVRHQLRKGLKAARYRLISPHAPLNWSSLAGRICVAEGLSFNFEADWDLARTSRYILAQRPFGLKRLYLRARLELHLVLYRKLLRHSTLSLVQGEDVYTAYRTRAPNVHSVLNVQITGKERISKTEVDRKVRAVMDGESLRLVYAGRASEMKGPMQWLEVMRQLHGLGVPFRASWLGGGELLSDMKELVAAHGLQELCALPGNVDKAQVLGAMSEAHLFVFCHMGFESPRNLMEAVASGAPLCGFGTDYSRGLVQPYGGGMFVERGDVQGLVQLIATLHRDRGKLAELIKNCARSGQELDRDRAIVKRIDLMKAYL